MAIPSFSVRLFFVRLLLAIGFIVSWAAGAAPLPPQPPLRVVLEQNYPPYAFRNDEGKLEGYSVDLWRLWERHTGRKVELHGVEWRNVQPMLREGRADVADTIFRTEARTPRFDFSTPYARVTTSIYAHASIAGIHDFGTLKGFQVTVQADDACGERLQRRGIDIRPLAYPALRAGLADRGVKLLCMDDYAASYAFYRLGVADEYVKAFEVVHADLRRAVRKGDAATLALVEGGMARIGAAEIDALHDKWMGRPLAIADLARPLLQALAVLAGLVVLLALWLVSVRRAVHARTRELEYEKAQLRTLVESSPDVIWLKDAAGIYRACNERLSALLGRPREAIVGKDDVALFGPEVAAGFRQDDAAALAAGHAVLAEEHIALPGEAGQRVFETIKTPVRNADGTVLGVLGVARDITRRRELEESMRMANLIYQTSLEAIVVTDGDNRIVDANPAFTSQTGARPADVCGTRPRLFDSAMHDSAFYAHLWQSLMAGDHWQGEMLDREADGTVTARFVDIRAIRQPDGSVYRHVIQFHDISAQKLKDELIWRQTNFDSLTGLPNRRLFLDRLAQDIRKAHGAAAGLGVLLLDLDRFRDVNDSFGPARGDEALVELTRRIALCLPDDATMGRLGGDAFALAVGELDGHRHLEELAQAVIEAVAVPLRLGPVDVAYVSASAGISVYPDDGTDAEELVRHAEHAVHLAKRAGRGQFQYFTPSLHQQAHAKLMLTNDLRDALARRELAVHYQPIVEVATGTIRKAETLLRWRHPQRGMVSPAQFIPLAEEAGLIGEISDLVLGEAIASVRKWHRMFGRVIELSVNISASQFEQRGPLSWLDRVVQAKLPRHGITVEITEGVLVHDAEQVTRCLGTLHAAGAKVSIDDFGTGFSALSYLKHFDIDYLKIDKSFINNLPGDSGDRALTEAIVDLAHRLGIEAIAEGVENGAQRDALAAIGCDYIQGYFYSQAVTREVFERLLAGQMAH